MSSTANEHHFAKELEEEIQNDEQRMEVRDDISTLNDSRSTVPQEYGGDDPEKPPVKPSGVASPPQPAGPPMPWMKPHDPNRVEWDGPDDPANPQNWGKPCVIYDLV